jgi:hypothetical protein
MTNLKALMDAASPLPWLSSVTADHDLSNLNVFLATLTNTSGDRQSVYDAKLAEVAVNALPAVLEYMKHEHHRYCAVVQQELWQKTWQLKQTIKRECTCGYDALRAALGVEK